MKLNGLYLLNNDWQLDTEINVHHGLECDVLPMREAIRLFGMGTVLVFSQSDVWLYIRPDCGNDVILYKGDSYGKLMDGNLV